MAASAVGVLVAAFFLFSVAARPELRDDASPALDPAETARSPRRSTRRASSYEVQNNGTALAVEKAKIGRRGSRSPSSGLAAARASPASSCSTSRSSAPATSSSRSPTSARSRARSPDRSAGRGRQGRAGQPRAPRGPALPDEQQPATAAVLLQRRRRRLDPARRARHRVARRLQRQGPEGRERLDHRPAPASCCGRTATARTAAAAIAQAAPSSATRSESRRSSTRCSLQTLGPGKAQVQVTADLNADQATREELTLRQEGHAAQGRTEETEELEGGGARRAAARRHARGNIPTYAGGRRRRRRLELRAQDDEHRPASARRSRAPRSRRARSTA